MKAIIVALSLVLGAPTQAPSSHVYDGTASYVLNWQITSWLLADNVAGIRSLRFQVVGAEGQWPGGGGEMPWYYFACWFQSPTGAKMLIDEIQVLPGPRPNNDELTQTTDFRSADYPNGLPAPDPGDAVYCGWEPPYGNVPPLTYGFGRVLLIFHPA